MRSETRSSVTQGISPREVARFRGKHTRMGQPEWEASTVKNLLLQSPVTGIS